MQSLTFQFRRWALKGVLIVCLSLFGRLAASAEENAKRVADVEGLPSRVAFGSCANQEKPQPILRQVVTRRPDLFVYLGDNIYGDTEDMAVLKAKYDRLGAKPEFQALRSTAATLAIWDDHDYGANDAGKEYPKKAASKEIFLDFWLEPEGTPRRQRPGIYNSHRFTDGARTLQVILLDTRTFRDPLARNDLSSWKNDYHPDPDPEKTLLGQAQWAWLAEVLAQPADIRIIATSIQFAHEYNGWESWTNLPRELRRMVETIRHAQAGGVLFISGDVHWGEISVLPVDGLYSLHDVTSSGLTEDWDKVEPNQNRYGEAIQENNFGLIEIEWAEEDPEITLSVVDLTGTARVQKKVSLSELQPGAKE